jgi:UDP-glucose 4-epimerase
MTVRTLLITGATGFVGGTILERARQLSRPAYGLVRSPHGSSRNHRLAAEWTIPALTSALDEVDAVIHCASVVHRPDAPSAEYVQFNVAGTKTLVDMCRARGVRLIYLSTIKVYGETPSGIIDESTAVAPDGPYAATKLAAENVILEAVARGDLSAAVLRLCPVYGVGDKGNVRAMIRAISRRRFVLPGDGSTRKSLVHASTVASIALAAADQDVGGVFVVADRHAPTMGELAHEIARSLGRGRPWRMPKPIVYAAASGIERIATVLGRPPFVTKQLIYKSLLPTVCSPSRVERELGVECHVELGPAIDEEVAWLRGLRAA